MDETSSNIQTQISSPEVEVASEQPTFVGRVRSAAQMAVVGAEVSPLNEVARYSLLGATIAAGGDAPTAAAVFGGSTLVIESSAALASAPLLSGERANKIADKLKSRLGDNSFILPQNRATNALVKGGVALGGGSAVTMALKKVEEPAIEKEELRKYGLKTSAYLAGVCAVHGALLSESIQHPSPETIGVTTIAIGGALAIAGWAKSKVKRAQSENE
jgi:hypothetical protein